MRERPNKMVARETSLFVINFNKLQFLNAKEWKLKYVAVHNASNFLKQNTCDVLPCTKPMMIQVWVVHPIVHLS